MAASMLSAGVMSASARRGRCMRGSSARKYENVYVFEISIDLTNVKVEDSMTFKSNGSEWIAHRK